MKRSADTETTTLTTSAGSSRDPGGAGLSIDSAIFREVPVAVEAKLGSAIMTISELLALRGGSIVQLDLKMNEPIELSLNNTVVARGEIVAVDDRFGVRITEVAQIK